MRNRRFLLALFWALVSLLFTCSIAMAGNHDAKEKEVVLKVGGSKLIGPEDYWPDHHEPRFKRVSAINPEIVDVQIVSPKLFYVFGKKLGSTSLILWERNGSDAEEPKVVDVIVFLDVTGLKQKIHELYPPPKQDIRVYASETGVVLSGTVSGPEVVEQVIRLTQTFLPIMAEDGGGQQGTGRSGMGITNLLKVQGVQQVMLEVKFAEVSRRAQKDWQAAIGIAGLGNDFSGAFGTSGVLTPIADSFVTAQFPNALTQSGIFEGAIDGLIQNPSSLLLNFAGNEANIFARVDNVTTALQFLETEGLARTLAEPRLVTQSGQEASFLAGGEFPLPVAQDFGEISIEYKEFGVALRFTPVVLSDGTISLRVAPSVSDIASESSIPAGIVGANFIVPNLATRKLETTVQLKDGQTLALAGLLRDTLRENVKKIPGLGDLPILGALFRSSSFLNEKTDLLIAVTPHLVKPVPEGSIQFPGEDMVAPNRYEFYLEGRLEGARDQNDRSGLSNHGIISSMSPADKKGGLEGAVGYQPVK